MARHPDLRDDIFTVSRGGKLSQRHSDDQRVGQHRTSALGEGDPRMGRDRLANAKAARGVMVSVIALLLCVGVAVFACLGSGCLCLKHH